MKEFAITTEKISDDSVLLHIQGTLDGITAEELSAVLDELIKEKIYKFIIDLAGVKYIGSPGIGAFIRVFDMLQDNKGTIVFIETQPNVKATFKMFKLSTFYSIAKDKETALKELRELCR